MANMSQLKRPTLQIRNRNHIRPDLIVRPVHPDDAGDVYAITSDPKVAIGLDWMPDAEFVNTQELLDKHDSVQHRLVAELDGTVVAIAWLKNFSRPRINHIGQLELAVRPDHWGQRIGTSLTMAILDLADNWLNLKRIEANVVEGNLGALRLLENLGFDVEGTKLSSLYGNGERQNEKMLARLRAFKDRPKPSGAEEFVHKDEKKQKRAMEIRNLSVRPVHPDDVNALYDIFRRPEVCRTTLQMPSQEINLTEDRVLRPPAGIHRFVAISEKQIVGSISIVQRQNPRRSHSAGLGMMVHPNFWGQGIGTFLMESILDLADNWLNLIRIDLLVNVDNPAGVRLYEKFGFVVEGMKRYHAYGDGRWADSYVMARLKNGDKLLN